MRALQLNPKHSKPQGWTQNCFYLCTYSWLVHCVLRVELMKLG